jgi:hypothetical protein
MRLFFNMWYKICCYCVEVLFLVCRDCYTKYTQFILQRYPSLRLSNLNLLSTSSLISAPLRNPLPPSPSLEPKSTDRLHLSHRSVSAAASLPSLFARVPASSNSNFILSTPRCSHLLFPSHFCSSTF